MLAWTIVFSISSLVNQLLILIIFLLLLLLLLLLLVIILLVPLQYQQHFGPYCIKGNKGRITFYFSKLIYKSQNLSWRRECFSFCSDLMIFQGRCSHLVTQYPCPHGGVCQVLRPQRLMYQNFNMYMLANHDQNIESRFRLAQSMLCCKVGIQ